MNILILHCMGDPLNWRAAVRDLEYLLPKCRPELDCLVHNAALPLPDFIKDIEFQGIVLGPTFLGARRNLKLLEAVKRKYDFVKLAPAFKIALPQDDYDCSARLDRWLMDWRVDVAYTVCPGHEARFYPDFSRFCRLKSGFTGYIFNEWIDRWQAPRPYENRPLDVVYRASKLPPFFGRLGHFKGLMGEVFQAEADRRGLTLRMDLSTARQDIIPGRKWQEFMESSKAALSALSGSSVWDPEGELRRRVMAFQGRRPRASFEEVEAACFPSLDGQVVATAISPRNLEAALTETLQIAVPGPYNGLLLAGEHYLPFGEDGSGFDEAIDILRRPPAARRVIKAAKEAVLSEDALRAERFAEELLGLIREGASARRLEGMDHARWGAIVKRYNSEMETVEKAFWRRSRMERRLKDFGLWLGLGRLRDILQGRQRRT